MVGIVSRVAKEGGHDVIYMDIAFMPTWVVAANRLIRMGRANKYGITIKAAYIDLRTPEGMNFASKFPDLRDVTSVILRYREDPK